MDEEGLSKPEMARRAMLESQSYDELNEDADQHKVATELMKLLPLCGHVKKMIYANASGHGRRIVVDDVLQFVNLPCHLQVADRLAVTKVLPYANLFSEKKLQKSRSVKLFLRYKEEQLDDPYEPHAMIFNWPRFGLVAMHDYGGYSSERPGVALQFSLQGCEPLSIEPLKQFIRRMLEDEEITVENELPYE